MSEQHISEPSISYEKLLVEFTELLKRNNLKYTKQREIILECLYNNNEHLTPELLHDLIQEKFPDIKVGIATVYRTLSLLEDSKMVTSISFGAAGKKYELDNKRHHDHMICTHCGTIIEFVDDDIERLQEEVARKFNFKITTHTMQIYGTCQACQTNNN